MANVREIERKLFENVWMPLRGSGRADGFLRIINDVHSGECLREYQNQTWVKTVTGYRDRFNIGVERKLGDFGAKNLRTRLNQLRSEIAGLEVRDIVKLPDIVVGADSIYVFGRSENGSIVSQAEVYPKMLLSDEITYWSVEKAVKSIRHLTTVGDTTGQYLFEVCESRDDIFWMVSKNPYSGSFPYSPMEREKNKVYLSQTVVTPESAFRSVLPGSKK